MDNTPAPEAVPSIAVRPERVAGRWNFILLSLMVVLLVLLAWQWLDQRGRTEALRQDFAKRLAGNDALLRESLAQAKVNQELVLTLQARVQGIESNIADAQSQQVALEAMYQEMSRTRDERVIAEVEQTITIAAQQLQLAGNVEAALIALNGAETRLARTAQPQFLPLRKLIARDIANLTAMPVADISGMAAKIEGIVAQVDGFPMASERRQSVAPASERTQKRKTQAAKTPLTAPADVAPPWWQALWIDLRSEITPLIRIERMERNDPGLLPPTQAYFLRENIKLRLINARLALLARDGRSFREDSRQVTEWLQQYFDSQAPAVQTAITTMKGFSRLDIVQQAPSLNETLSTVRNFKPGRK